MVLQEAKWCLFAVYVNAWCYLERVDGTASPGLANHDLRLNPRCEPGWIDPPEIWIRTDQTGQKENIINLTQTMTGDHRLQYWWKLISFYENWFGSVLTVHWKLVDLILIFWKWKQKKLSDRLENRTINWKTDWFIIFIQDLNSK
jgi:hypothetical protein